MSIEYWAWGFFMGLAFVFTALALNKEDVRLKKIKVTIMTCGILCITGLIGPVLSNELLWFISVTGYAIGTPVICIQLIFYYKRQLRG